MYLKQNIFGQNLQKFQFNISSLAIFILQLKFKKKYFFDIFVVSANHITGIASRDFGKFPDHHHLFPKGCKFCRFAENGTIHVARWSGLFWRCGETLRESRYGAFGLYPISAFMYSVHTNLPSFFNFSRACYQQYLFYS